MIDQTFSASNFMSLMGRTDPGKYKLGRAREDYQTAMEEVSKKAHDSNFEFSKFATALRVGKSVFSSTTTCDEFIIRKLNDNLRRSYNVRQANRAEIMSQVKLLLQEKLPFYVLKIDIKDFYESTDREFLVKSICNESLITYRGKELLKKLFLGSRHFAGKGLPRGISVSATLSEINMIDFDKKIRSIEGVYYYARYVDDMIIFSYKDSNEIIFSIKKALYPKMQVNDKKTESVEFNEYGNCIKYLNNPEISYLGYKFEFRLQSSMPKGNLPKGSPPPPPRMEIKIADNKIEKLKKRIILSLLSYAFDKDFSLLASRIKFLSGNCKMRRKGETGELLSGIYYNYPLIDEPGKLELKMVSQFLRNAIYSKRGSFGAKIQSNLSSVQKEELAKLCFYAGHQKKITQNISAKRLQQIKKCWNHA
ncbi:MAG: antiviral reverse transcriptase Drt3a [Massilia sp.]